jgi:hypothetical protein
MSIPFPSSTNHGAGHFAPLGVVFGAECLSTSVLAAVFGGMNAQHAATSVASARRKLGVASIRCNLGVAATHRNLGLASTLESRHPPQPWGRLNLLLSRRLAATRAHVHCWGQSPAKIEEFTLLRSFHGNL